MLWPHKSQSVIHVTFMVTKSDDIKKIVEDPGIDDII